MIQLTGGGAMATGLGGCSFLYYGTWNFLWTVAVNTKDGPKSGSAVYQISLYPPWFVAGFGIKQAGVSPVIDLGERGSLIALAKVDIAILPEYDKAHVPPGAFGNRVDILTGLPFVRFTYWQGEIGWHCGKEWPRDQVLAYASSALSSAKKVTAPNDAQPVFAYAPRDARNVLDLKGCWAYELPVIVGPDVNYVESTIEPISAMRPADRLETTADWYVNSHNAMPGSARSYNPAEARASRSVFLQEFGEGGL